MSEHLYIWLGLAPDAPWFWVTSAQGFGCAIDLDARAKLSQTTWQDVSVIVPGQWVASHLVSVPEVKGASRLSAAQFAVEDRLAESLDRQHIALGTSNNDGQDLMSQNTVLVISKDKMRDVLDAMKLSGFSPDFIFADFDIFPKSSETIALDDRLIMPGHACTIDRDWLHEVGEAAPMIQPSFEEMAALMSTESAINLRSGNFAKRRDWSSVSSVMSGRQAAAFAALLLILGVVLLGQMAAQTKALNLQAAEMEMKAGKIYTRVTGQAAPRDPARAILTQLKTQPLTRQDYTQDIAALFAMLETIEGVSLESLQYSPGQAGLTLRLEYPSFETTAQLEALAKSKGMQFEARGMREQGGRLLGEAIFIRGEGS